MAAAGRRLLIADPTDPTAPARAARRFGAYCAAHRVSVDDAAALVGVHVASLRRRDRRPWDDARIPLAVGAGWAQHRLDEPVLVTPEDLVDFL
jgi:hypothetical protein